MAFGTLMTPAGYVVIDEDTGREVTRDRPNAQSAAATALILNNAARKGPVALARALGCVEDGESDFLAVKF